MTAMPHTLRSDVGPLLGCPKTVDHTRLYSEDVTEKKTRKNFHRTTGSLLLLALIINIAMTKKTKYTNNRTSLELHTALRNSTYEDRWLSEEAIADVIIDALGADAAQIVAAFIDKSERTKEATSLKNLGSYTECKKCGEPWLWGIEDNAEFICPRHD